MSSSSSIWEECEDPNKPGQCYYYNTKTGESQWDCPPELVVSTEPKEPLPPEWEECNDDQGHIYYFNVVTSESSWVRPTAKEEKKQQESLTPAELGECKLDSCDCKEFIPHSTKPDKCKTCFHTHRSDVKKARKKKKKEKILEPESEEETETPIVKDKDVSPAVQMLLDRPAIKHSRTRPTTPVAAKSENKDKPKEKASDVKKKPPPPSGPPPESDDEETDDEEEKPKQQPPTPSVKPPSTPPKVRPKTRAKPAPPSSKPPPDAEKVNIPVKKVVKVEDSITDTESESDVTVGIPKVRCDHPSCDCQKFIRHPFNPEFCKTCMHPHNESNTTSKPASNLKKSPLPKKGARPVNVNLKSIKKERPVPSGKPMQACNHCGCTKFTPNPFKKGQCKQCWHNHETQPEEKETKVETQVNVVDEVPKKSSWKAPEKKTPAKPQIKTTPSKGGPAPIRSLVKGHVAAPPPKGSRQKNQKIDDSSTNIPCNMCDCETFVINPFKKGICKSCWHNHDGTEEKKEDESVEIPPDENFSDGMARPRHGVAPRAYAAEPESRKFSRKKVVDTVDSVLHRIADEMGKPDKAQLYINSLKDNDYDTIDDLKKGFTKGHTKEDMGISKIFYEALQKEIMG